MYNTPTGQAVRATLHAIAASGEAPNAASMAALRARLCAAVDELKSMGWPIERIIVRMKELGREVGLPANVSAYRNEREAIISEAVRFCIERYFDNN